MLENLTVLLLVLLSIIIFRFDFSLSKFKLKPPDCSGIIFLWVKFSCFTILLLSFFSLLRNDSLVFFTISLAVYIKNNITKKFKQAPSPGGTTMCMLMGSYLPVSYSLEGHTGTCGRQGYLNTAPEDF